MEHARPQVGQPCGTGDFAAQLHDFADRVRRSQHASLASPYSPELLEQSLAELGNAVEEMRVAQEEMTRQRDELRETQEELGQQRRRYKELFDYAPSPYVVTNLVGTIAEANAAAAALLHVRREFLVGGSLLKFIEPERRMAFRDALAIFTAAQPVEAPQTWEAIMLRRQRGGGSLLTAEDAADGRRSDSGQNHIANRGFEAELTVSRMRTLLDEPDKLLWLVRDVTALHESQRLVRQSERLAALGQMVATFAHESGNALQRSQAGLEMLVSRVVDLPDAVELLAEIQSANDHLAHLQKQIKDYAGPVRIEKLPCHLGKAVECAWQSLHLATTPRQASLEQLNEASSLTCPADSGAVQQVFRNVLENSLAACRDPVRIQVRFSDVALHGLPALEIRVQDNGTGMSPAVRQRIFEPFFTTRVRGMGLGMAIVKRIIEAHGGEVAVDSASEAGTGVIIILPRGES